MGNFRPATLPGPGGRRAVSSGRAAIGRSGTASEARGQAATYSAAAVATRRGLTAFAQILLLGLSRVSTGGGAGRRGTVW